MNTKDTYTNFAQEAWNEAANVHWKTTKNIVKGIKDPTTSYIDGYLAAELKRIGIAGADVAQLNCNNGTELISIKRLGANRCVGFDIADEFIAQAKRFNEASGTDCSFTSSWLRSLRQATLKSPMHSPRCSTSG